MAFKDSTRPAVEVGRALRADYLLEGSIRCEGDRVRITARLVETASETHLWVESYEPALTDYLSVQKDVAARIAHSLTMELIPDAPGASHGASSNPLAYQAYLKGRYYWNMLADYGVDQAIAHFDRAVALDPTFASAHAAMSRARILHAEYYGTVPRRALEAARQSAKQALDLEPALFEAHLALGEVRRMLEWDWRGAEAAYAQAIVLNPSHEGAHRGYGLLLAALGRRTEAFRETERASDMDPLCVVVNVSGAAWVRYLAGDYDAAIARSRRAVELEPRYLAAHRILAAAYLRSGREAEAIAVLERALAAAGDDPRTMAELSYARAVTGNRDGAADLVTRVMRLKGTRHVPAYPLALAHAGLGDLDSAFADLEQATVDADPALTNLAVEPRFEAIRSDVRYERLVELLGLA
jgi:adenylate cyclase